MVTTGERLGDDKISDKERGRAALVEWSKKGGKSEGEVYSWVRRDKGGAGGGAAGGEWRVADRRDGSARRRGVTVIAGYGGYGRFVQLEQFSTVVTEQL